MLTSIVSLEQHGLYGATSAQKHYILFEKNAKTRVLLRAMSFNIYSHVGSLFWYTLRF